MIIRECQGYELEKAKPNTSEDMFNRSEVTFMDGGEEKTFHLLYVRFFDEHFGDFTPYGTNPLFKAGDREVFLKDVAGLAALISNPANRHKKRIYINNEKEYAKLFKNIDFQLVEELFKTLAAKGEYELQSPMAALKQP
ncbi:hypothetical protein [Bacillus marinisedimentorum]|uniref:hypothetical protein n=1 Tax=Bacillus marinisedimentorum TaxID=1821260 RepID=UPI0009F5B7C9|nr:hypothetical protein [Bacillus marinisedimentorum]